MARIENTAQGAGRRLEATYDHGFTFREAFWTWVRVGLLSFGGPAGQIAVMHRILVEEKHWIGENRFLHALNYCMLLPGPEATQLAIYVGWLLHKTKGGLVAGFFFVLPGIVAIMALGWLYAGFGNIGAVLRAQGSGAGGRPVGGGADRPAGVEKRRHARRRCRRLRRDLLLRLAGGLALT